MPTKKGLMKSFLIGTIILIFSFFIIFGVMMYGAERAETATAEATCRLTLAAREEATIPIKPKGVPLGEIKLPKICPIIDVDADSPEKVYEYMARCKAMYGYFLIDNIFEGDYYNKRNCRTCFIVTTKKSDKWPKEGVSEKNIIKEMTKKVYKVFPAYDDYCKSSGGISGGFCADSDVECTEDMDFDIDNKECKKIGKGCCWSRFSCINKGGKCAEEGTLNKEEWIKYNNPQWRCPSGKDCHVHKDNYHSYFGYIRNYRGIGIPIILTPIKANEVYWISYGEPNEKCKLCEDAGLFTGLTTAGATIAAIGISTTGVGLVATVVGTVAGVIVHEITKEVADTSIVKEIIQKREDHVIYLTTPQQARNANSCNVLE